MPLSARRAGPPIRIVRAIASQASLWTLALAVGLGGWAGTAAAATGGSGSTDPSSTDVTSLQTRAQELAGEISADGRKLDELAATYETAQINYQRLSAEQDQLRRSMAATTAAVAAARQALKDQAILAYLAGGAPVISYVPNRPGMDPSLTIAYAEIVAGGQKAAVQTYRATLAEQATQTAALDANTRQVAAALASIRSDQSRAEATLASQRQALSQVKGKLAVEVAKVQAAQRAAEQAQEKAALSASGLLPPSTPAASGGGSQPASQPQPGAQTQPGAEVQPVVQTRPTTQAQPAPPVTVSSSRPTAPPTTAAPPSTTSAPTTPAPTSQTTPPAKTTPTGGSAAPAQAPGVNSVLSYARAQLGKPYQWAAAGPNSFDCSGLVMMAWEQAGIYFPHLAQDQYDLTARIPLSQLIPGDLVFFGTPNDVYHVGIYVGNGDMIDAPETGQNVQVQSIYWDSLLGAGRVTSSS